MVFPRSGLEVHYKGLFLFLLLFSGVRLFINEKDEKSPRVHFSNKFLSLITQDRALNLDRMRAIIWTIQENAEGARGCSGNAQWARKDAKAIAASGFELVIV